MSSRYVNPMHATLISRPSPTLVLAYGTLVPLSGNSILIGSSQPDPVQPADGNSSRVTQLWGQQDASALQLALVYLILCK